MDHESSSHRLSCELGVSQKSIVACQGEAATSAPNQFRMPSLTLGCGRFSYDNHTSTKVRPAEQLNSFQHHISQFEHYIQFLQGTGQVRTVHTRVGKRRSGTKQNMNWARLRWGYQQD